MIKAKLLVRVGQKATGLLLEVVSRVALMNLFIYCNTIATHF